MKIERVKFRDAIMVNGNDVNIVPNYNMVGVDIETDGETFVVSFNDKTVFVPKSNVVYWIEAPKPAPKAPAPKS